MKHNYCYISLAILLAASTRIADGATGICGTDSDDGVCRFEQSMTCDEMIQTHAFTGDCCSLSSDPVTGNCVVTISGGSCGFYNRCNTECYFETCTAVGACVVPYMVWNSESLEACPPSEIDVFNLKYEEECPHCTCCPDTDSQNCLAKSPTTAKAIGPHPDTPPGTPEDEIEWFGSYSYNYTFVRTHPPGLGDLGSLKDPSLLEEAHLEHVTVTTAYDQSPDSNVMLCAVQIGSEPCTSCTPCDDGNISADCSNIHTGIQTECKNPWAFYPFQPPGRCSEQEPTPPTTKRVILKPHLTFFFEAGREDLVEPTRTEIMLLDEQTEKYIWDILQEEEYAVKSVQLDNLDHSFAPIGQAGNFKHQFETRFSATIDISPEHEPIIPKSMAQLLVTNDNLSNFVGQYARYYGEKEDPVPNGPFFHVSMVQARVAAIGEVFEVPSSREHH